MEKFSGINMTDEMRYQTPYVNSTLFPLLLLSLARQKHSADPKTKFAAEYDFIVVGGGVGGSVVASRLSEIPDVTVLLLEAGSTPPLVTEIPAMSVLFARSDLTWNYRSTPQKYVGRNIRNGTIPTSTGKVLGGGSTINGMLNVRGNRQNYDQWSWDGASGWSYEEVLPYFKKLEDNKNLEYLQNSYHGSGGPITVENLRYDSEIRRAIMEASLSLGYEFVDVNGPRQTGIYDHQTTTRDAQRCSTNKAYLVAAQNRPNLDILTKALVTKIIFDGRKAVAVLFDYLGYTYEVRTRREIILSAGAYRTPQLLMLSGIGPREELKKFDIPVIADLAVGANLQNHWVTFMVYEINESVKKFTDALNEEENVLAYIYSRTGPLTMSAGVYFMAFLNTYETKPRVDTPDVNLLITDFLIDFALDYFNYSTEDFQKYIEPQRNKNTLSCTVQNLNTKSIGSVSLKSRNPYDDPLIDFNALSNSCDVEDLVRGLKLCQTLMSTPAMKNIGAKPFEHFVPQCDGYAHDEELYLECFVRNIISDGVHVVGTAKMGSIQDPTTVVDPQLRVKNIEGLRVVDASVMPNVPWGNTYIPTAMVAEKASDMIKLSLQVGEGYL